MNEERYERFHYIIGAVASVALTILAFGTVVNEWDRMLALWVIGVTAVAQIVVQLRFFLHIGFSGQKREDLLLILFSLLMLSILAGGTIWILGNLSQRMM